MTIYVIYRTIYMTYLQHIYEGDSQYRTPVSVPITYYRNAAVTEKKKASPFKTHSVSTSALFQELLDKIFKQGDVHDVSDNN